VKVFSLNGDVWDRAEDRSGWRSKDAWVGAHVGAELIGGSMYELEAGDRLWPYHAHHANEEWMIVLRGRATLRTPEGEQELEEGDVVCFRRGREGLHQVRNATDEPIRVLMLSTLVAPDVVEYPEGRSRSWTRRESDCFASFAGPTPSTGKASPSGTRFRRSAPGRRRVCESRACPRR
jgi:uncharacterized cupin superfamily protein